MNLSKLNKEQKQYMVLGAIVAAALIVLAVFGIRFSLSSISKARLELVELTGKIDQAEKSVARSEQSNPDFLSSIEKLRECLNDIPPERNYYSWATEIIYRESRLVGFEIDAVDETVVPSPPEQKTEKSGVEMESYALRITAHGGYENIKQFLNRFAVNHPLVRVTGIEISRSADPETHDVQLFIEWPYNLGYITESWESARTFTKKTAPEPAVGKKMPTPPPPRTEGSDGEAARQPAKRAAPGDGPMNACSSGGVQSAASAGCA
jgi:hypothetical protein